MCIKRVLFCPACLRYGKLLKESVPAEPGAIIRVIREIPCGFSTCEWFNPIFSFLEGSVITTEIMKPCSSACNPSLCQIMPVVEICCDGQRQWHSIRLRQAKPWEPEAYVDRALKTEFPPLVNPNIPISEHNSADLLFQEIEIAKIASEELHSFLFKTVTEAECKEIGNGKTIILDHPDFFIELRGRNRMYYDVLVTDHRFYGRDGATTKFECMFGLLLNRVFWRCENERQRVDLKKLFNPGKKNIVFLL